MTGEKCWSNYLVLVKCLKILTRNLNVCSSVPRNLLFCSYLLLMPVCFLRVKKLDMMCHCLMHGQCAVDRLYGSNLRKTTRQTSLAKFQNNHDSWQLKKITDTCMWQQFCVGQQHCVTSTELAHCCVTGMTVVWYKCGMTVRLSVWQ